MILAVFVLFLLSYSCAVKVVEDCADAQELISLYSAGGVPQEFTAFGRIKAGPVRKPVMLVMKDGRYSLRVGGVRNVRLERERVCFKGRCYALPFEPARVLFGGVLSGREEYYCRDGMAVLRSEEGLYRAQILFSGRKLEEIRVVGSGQGKELRILFGDRDPSGFFRNITFEAGGERFKLEIEEVRI